MAIVCLKGETPHSHPKNTDVCVSKMFSTNCNADINSTASVPMTPLPHEPDCTNNMEHTLIDYISVTLVSRKSCSSDKFWILLFHLHPFMREHKETEQHRFLIQQMFLRERSMIQAKIEPCQPARQCVTWLKQNKTSYHCWTAFNHTDKRDSFLILEYMTLKKILL